MKWKPILLLAGLGALLFSAGMLVGGQNGASNPHPMAVHDHEGQELDRILDEAGSTVWTCSMHPQVRLPEPGQCPICFMDLIPVDVEPEGERTSMRELTLSEEAKMLAGIRVAAVLKQDVAVETRMSGKVEYDETRRRAITAWTGGRIEKMHIDFTGREVVAGQPMVAIYSPALVTAQAELIEAVRAVKDLEKSSLSLVRESAVRTERAAREKLRLLGLEQEQIAGVITRGRPTEKVTLNAPQGGIVIRKDVDEGEYVKTGMPLYAIADLSKVWVILDAYETDLPWIAVGREVEFRTDAEPGRTFSGEVVYIDPVVSETTRTVRVRLSVDNRDGRLKPGMLVRATHHRQNGTEAASLVIPASAPLITGKRAIVYVEENGRYEGREVVLGPRAGDAYIVKSGLAEGELVVTRGNFKIDSAIQIVARPSMMTPASGTRGTEEEALPDLFLSQIRLLDKRFKALEAVVAKGDFEATHLEFARFGKAVRMVEDDALEGRPALLWKEAAMRLGNDAILGAEARDGKRLSAVFSEMATHYGMLTAAFPVAGEDRKGSVPEAFRKEVAGLLGQYEALSGSLSRDDLEGAILARDRLLSEARKISPEGLDDASKTLWEKARSSLDDGLSIMKTASGMEGLRKGFEKVSTGLVEMVTGLGADTDSSLYVAHCPMAFDFEGASWLQTKTEIRNPYFGAAMLRCGEVTEQLR